MELSSKDAIDIVKLAYGANLDKTGKGFIDLSQVTQTYSFPDFLSKPIFKGGDKLFFTNMMRHNQEDISAGSDEAEDTYNISDNLLDQGEVNWAEFKHTIAWNKKEIAKNVTDEGALAELIVSRHIDKRNNACEQYEKLVWTCPTSKAVAAQKKQLLGIPYWIVKNTSDATSTPTLCGLNPSGWSDVANIDSSDANNSNWRNWCAKYTKADALVPDSGLILTLRQLALRLNYVPAPLPAIGQGNGENRTFQPGQYRLYTNWNMLEKLWAYDTKYGSSAWAGLPFTSKDFIAVPELNNDSTDPIYFIHGSSFQSYALTGYYFKENGLNEIPGRHNYVGNIWDNIQQMVCRDRKRQAVIFGA